MSGTLTHSAGSGVKSHVRDDNECAGQLITQSAVITHEHRNEKVSPMGPSKANQQ